MNLNKLYITISFLLFAVLSTAQVGINTDAPRSEVALDINGNTNVSERIFLGNQPLNQPTNPGALNDIIVSSGSVNPTAWVKKTIPDGFGESFALTYMNSYFDITGVDIASVNTNAYALDDPITTDWKVLTNLDNSFTVYRASNKVNLIFQTTGQLNVTGGGNSSASFACGIFMKLQSETLYRLKGVRTDAVRGSTGANKIINLNLTLENLPVPGGAGGTVYNTRVACFGRNVQSTFAIGKSINASFLNQEMAKSSLNVSVLESAGQ